MTNKEKIIVENIKRNDLEIWKDKRDVFREQHKLKDLFLELTLQCNLGCYHCGSRCEKNKQDAVPTEMLIHVLNRVKETYGIDGIRIDITGGEPLLREDFFDIMKAIHELGFHFGMTSNATLITKEVAQKLHDVGLNAIAVSIDGVESTHDRLRGMNGAYKKAMTGIQNLIDVGGFDHLNITTVVNHETIHELDALYDIILDIDVDSWRIAGLEPIGRALEHKDLLLTADDWKYMLDFIYQKRCEQMPVMYGCPHYLGIEYERDVRDWYFLCNAGIRVASIMANGDIGACLDIERMEETIQGNIYKDDFVDVWENRFEIFRKRLSSRSKICKDCEHEPYCQGDSAHSFDYDKNEPMVCLKKIQG